MASDPIRDVKMSDELAARIKEYAYQNRKSISVVMGEFATRFATKGFTGIRKPEDKHPGRVRIGFVIPDEAWEAAADKAWELRTSRSEGIRIVAAEATKKVQVP